MRQFPASPITVLIDDHPRHNLGESCGRDLAVNEVLDRPEMKELAELPIGYGTSQGDIRLRELIAVRHGVAADQVLVTSGAAAALFILGLSFCDGEIVIGLPCYPPTMDTVLGLGAAVQVVRSTFDHGYRIDLDEVRRQLSPRTSLVLFASPQNPSGLRIADSDVLAVLEHMGQICPTAYLVIDETFREATFAEDPPPSLAGISPHLVTCASLSKAYGVPGLRIGWLTTSDPALYKQLRLAKFNAAIACGSVDEFLAMRVLANADGILAQRAQELVRARETVEAWVDANAGRVRWLRPDAGAFCAVELSSERFDSAAMTRFHTRLRELGTSVAQGPWFGDAEQIIRIGLTYEPIDRLREGLQTITAAMDYAERLKVRSARGPGHPGEAS
ncbi:MAG TPA: pyridoxal phosphate-dependent aminotransferase [Jiangellaceae bacterium]|nr:pyridoxal phosphate-dependent aminotransferase [Jiangellaceae bacterium]